MSARLNDKGPGSTNFPQMFTLSCKDLRFGSKKPAHKLLLMGLLMEILVRGMHS
jgi:hypothetical protein